jgi:hypothetical protein
VGDRRKRRVPVTTPELTTKQLRQLYVNATLKQRYRIASQRIDFPALGTNVLPNVVSALEGFARAIAVRNLVIAGTPVQRAYAALRDVNAIELISQHICPAYRITPTDAFGARAWRQIPEVLQWRHLLVHEATFLNGYTCKRLIAATRHCFDRLAELSDAV